MLTVVGKRQTTWTATKTARYEVRGLVMPCAELNADGNMVRTAQHVLVPLQRWSSLHRCQLRAESVCEKSGEAGAVDMEAAGLNRNIQWTGPFYGPWLPHSLRAA